MYQEIGAREADKHNADFAPEHQLKRDWGGEHLILEYWERVTKPGAVASKQQGECIHWFRTADTLLVGCRIHRHFRYGCTHHCRTMGLEG